MYTADPKPLRISLLTVHSHLNPLHPAVYHVPQLRHWDRLLVRPPCETRVRVLLVRIRVRDQLELAPRRPQERQPDGHPRCGVQRLGAGERDCYVLWVEAQWYYARYEDPR